MNNDDLVLIRHLLPAHRELERLVHKHGGYEERLARMVARRWQSPSELAEMKQLKRLKLAGRDRIASILAEHRSKASA